VTVGPLRVRWLGRVPYGEAYDLQRALFEHGGAQHLLLLEHPPVYTLGVRADPRHVLVPPASVGADLVRTDRGGDVTYHGPGQVVGYPIFLLPKARQDVRRYVRDVERCIVQTLAEYGLQAGIIPKWPGVWLGGEGSPDARKVAAIGVHISRWLTTHGFALNVNTHLPHFNLIIPCGIREAGVTSMQRELGHPISVPEVEEKLARHFSEVFESPQREAGISVRTVSITLLRGHGPEARVLLVRRIPERGGFWQTITGRVEPGESPEHTAARELEEETGLNVPVRALDYRHAFALGEILPPMVVEETAFAAWCPEGHEVRLGPEHDGHEWLEVPAALQRLEYRGLREGVKRAAALPGR
jgi:lipoyl(octanoyl) transferase